MKSKKIFLLLIIPFVLSACLKPKQDDVEKTEASTTVNEENVKEENIQLEYIPAVIVTAEAWYAMENEEEGVLEWESRLLRFDKLYFLGVEKEWTYKNSSGKKGEGLFYLCEIEKDDEKIQVWFFHNKVRKQSRPGVVIAEAFVFEEDDIMAIMSDKVKVTDLVVVDTEYSNDTFKKVRIPSLSESKDYYLEKNVVSTQPMDLKIVEVLEKAKTFGEGEEEVKRKLLLTAVDKLGGSSLIDLVVEEVNKIDNAEFEEAAGNVVSDESGMDESMEMEEMPEEGM